MKNSQSIISNIIKKQHLNKLGQSRDLEKLKVFLPKNIKADLLFIIIKHTQILFAFKNPIICNEFNRYITKNIQNSIQEYQDFFSFLPKQYSIKGYIPRNQFKKYQVNQQVTIQTYAEVAFGTFHNHSKDKKIHECFERLRQIIIKK